MLPQPNADWVAKLISAAHAVSAAVILAGCVVLSSWALGLPTLASLISGLATMKINNLAAEIERN